MKSIFYALLTLLLINSCASSRDYLLRGDEDKTLFDIIKRLNKRADDQDATKALAVVYKQVQEKHLKKIATYRSYKDMGRWDKLNNEYSILQNMFDAIDNSDASLNLVTPVSYRNEIADIREGAAEDYYQLGDRLLDNPGRENAKRAYAAFKKAGSWVKGYRDSQLKMEDAYNSSILNVVINPIQDNSFFFNTGWGNTGYNYSNEYFQQNLIRDLGGAFASQYPARFFADWEARREGIQTDWIVDLTLRNMDIPRPAVYNYSLNRSRQIQVGSDTSGKPIYQTVTATVNIQRQSFNARAQMDIQIVEIATRRNVVFNTFNDTYNWQQEVATYRGDKRALTNEDWALINNNINLPRREDILARLYSNIYPQVRNRISNQVDW